MTRRNILSLIVGLSMASTFSCKDGWLDCPEGKGNRIDTNLIIQEPFDTLSPFVYSVLTLEQGAYNIKLNGQSNVIRSLQYYVSKGKFIIDFGSCIRNYDDLNATLKLPTLSSIHLNEYGKFSSVGVWKADAMELKMNGSGFMDFNFDLNSLYVKQMAGGEIDLKGNSKALNLEVTGNGPVKAYDLKVNRCRIIHRGAGNIEVSVKDTLIVDMDNDGFVFYKGKPWIDSSITGLGKLVRVE